MKEQDKVEEFTNGRVGMMIDSLAHINLIRETNPDLKFSISAIPAEDGYTGKRGIPYASWGIGIADNSEHKAEAFKLVAVPDEQGRQRGAEHDGQRASRATRRPSRTSARATRCSRRRSTSTRRATRPTSSPACRRPRTSCAASTSSSSWCSTASESVDDALDKAQTGLGGGVLTQSELRGPRRTVAARPTDRGEPMQIRHPSAAPEAATRQRIRRPAERSGRGRCRRQRR